MHIKIKNIDILKFEYGEAIPWFNQKGLGKQTKWNIPREAGSHPKSLTQLAEEGYIKITIEKSPNGKFNNLANKIISKKLDFSSMDLPAAFQHVRFRDLSTVRNRGIGGCHDAIEFAKVRQINAIGNTNYQVSVGKTLDEVEEIVILQTRNSTTPGVKIIEYKIPAVDAKLKTTGALKEDGTNPFTKTTYDPVIWSDSKLEKSLKEALQDAANKGNFIENKFVSGLSKEGYEIEFIIRNGKVETFYFK